MSHLAVHIWTSEHVDSGFVDAAVNTVEDILEPQLDFSIYAYREDTDYDYSGGGWDDIREDFHDYVEDKEGGSPHSWDCHLLLIEDLWPGFGAGTAWGLVNRPEGSFSSGEAAACGVNCALKAYVNGNCEGDGGTAFRNTVIQEILHTLLGLHLNCNSAPGSSEHSLGSIYIKAGDNGEELASPIITWCSANNCGDNYDVEDNCNGTHRTYRQDYSTELSDCTIDEVENYYDCFF